MSRHKNSTADGRTTSPPGRFVAGIDLPSLLLATLSAVLLSLPWLLPYTSWLLLLAFVPLLLAEDRMARRGQRGALRYYGLTFVLWNVLTTWWICNATFIGGLVAFVGNAAQMCLVFGVFRWMKRHAGQRMGYATLVLAWLAWEWFYFDAEITWTWLTLGNGFARDIALVQWYEITGVLGGSLWVWVANLHLFFIVRRAREGWPLRRQARAVMACALWILVPAAASVARYLTYTEVTKPVNALLLQPNIDPYSEKFGSVTYQQQADILMDMAAEGLDPSIDFVVGPETSLLGRHWEDALQSNPHILQMKAVVAAYPRANFVTGLESQRYYPQGTTPTPTARPVPGTNDFYDSYNAAVMVNNTDSVSVYHKSKLVVGVETLPYYSKLKFIRKLSIDLGGTSGALGTQAERTMFRSADRRFNLGVAVCFESVYGQYFGGYVRNGANIMAVITNDGWWGNTAGYWQHLSFASLRAIETRRGIMRSGNTGISALINQRGQVLDQTPWWVRTSIKGSLNANDQMTFYTRHGDIVGRLAALMFVLCLLYGVQAALRGKSNL